MPTGYSFRLRCKRGGNGVWQVSEQNGAHNHILLEDICVHLKVRHLTAQQKERCHQLQLSGVKPSGRLALLRQAFLNIKAVMRDVHNEKEAQREVFLGDRTPVQALVDLLNERQYTYRLERDSQRRVTSLCYTHPLSLTLLRQHHHVLFLDATSKTSKFKIPLLVCTGVTLSAAPFLDVWCS